jgi:hypothetical protein
MLDESTITDATPTVSTLLQNLYGAASDQEDKRKITKILTVE